jgi:hypothetical protein
MNSTLARRTFLWAPFATAWAAAARDWGVEIEQLTQGPRHHYFGYIGHVKNTPWNGDGRYMVLLSTGFQDHMPAPAEAADVVLVDTRRNNTVEVIDQSRAWNPQQGTMFYWNPKAADTQLIFNDRDLKNNHVFAVLYDIAKRKRIKEYRYEDTPFGNSGVAQHGGYFLGLNYGRLARLRPVTGYPGAYDWSKGVDAPDNDGIFLVAIETGKKRLLVSFRQLAESIASKRPDVAGKHLFINHTLWNRDDDRIYFYVRGDFDSAANKLDIPCTIRPDGSGLTVHPYVGGHPEWEFGSRLIGDSEHRQVLYDVDKMKIVGPLGPKEILPTGDADSALSFDGKWFVNGYRVGHEDFYAILRRSDGSYLRTRGMPVDQWTEGDLRLDPAPCWNRTSDMIAFPAIANDKERTRQTFLLRIKPVGKE